jgi:two-component system, chemotaxis family, CheB/CheR fusion protein
MLSIGDTEALHSLKPIGKFVVLRVDRAHRPYSHTSSGDTPVDTSVGDSEHSVGNSAQIASTSCPIVGIVASAGGLDAFKQFFAAMPANSGMAFVLIPHLDPSHDSMMVELLSKWTSMPVTEARQGMEVLVNSLYIIPPRHFLSISKGKLQLNEPPLNHGSQTSMDFFLRSLARDQGERAIGIVLSGTGSHGTLGVREIKLMGGMVMAQLPETAEYDQMPRSAIATGVVDYALPPSQMPDALVKYVEQPYLSSQEDATFAAEHTTDLLNQILLMLQSSTKYDFRPYRKPMVLRRIQRRMGIIHIDSMSLYLDHLRQHPEEVTALYKDLLISVTAFFRDPEAYEILEKELIPSLLARHHNDLPIRVWVPGCATGEEAYSIAMLLFEGLASAKAHMKIQVFASDIDVDAIEIARAGVYPASIAEDISPERLKKYFVAVDEQRYQICKDIRESVVFSHQNLIGDAPFSKLDFISCRNVLIYLEPEMQKNVIAIFHFALVSDGYLLLGPSESIGNAHELFETVSKKWRVFRRIESARRDLVNIPIRRSPETALSALQPSSQSVHRKNFKELIEQLILNEYAPAAALCNRSLEVLYVTGPLVNFLEFPRGELSKDLLAMARPGLRTKLRATCKNAIRDGKVTIESGAKVNRNGEYFRCSITARPLTDPKEANGLILVLFRDQPAETAPNAIADSPRRENDPETIPSEDSQIAQQLESELKSMSEELRSTIEDMESSNEELKASNEELMSVNEELQSVNEELETSKEELQSLNEELSTVNSQLQEKVAELKQATDDLMNLMSSTEIATIFLDEQMNIKRFTPPTKSLLNLLATDVGRPLKDIAPKFADDTMLSECFEVLAQQEPIEREVMTDEPRHYLRRILPYRTNDSRVGGVVITFVDLTHRKRLEEIQRAKDARHFAELYESAERMQAILNAAADAIVTVDSNGKIESINHATESLFYYTQDQLIGKNLSLLMPESFGLNGDDSIPKNTEAELKRLVGSRQEVLAQRKDGSTFPADLALSKVDHLGLFTFILRDISVQKQLQTHVLEIASEEQSRIGQELHDGTQQELTGLSLFAGTVKELLNHASRSSSDDKVDWVLHDKDFQKIRDTISKLTLGLLEANQHVHKLSHGIMPVEIDAQGIRSALAELAASTNQHPEIHCHFDFSGPGIITNNMVATQLYRIAQESLNNAIKHGKATDIRISLSQHPRKIVLEICDNGVGFVPHPSSETSATEGGFGLRIMEYRASVLGGNLQLIPNDGTGITVRCIVPVKGDLT